MNIIFNILITDGLIISRWHSGLGCSPVARKGPVSIPGQDLGNYIFWVDAFS